mgnify:CR=1 FL=1
MWIDTPAPKATKKKTSKKQRQAAEEARRRWSHAQGPWLSAANAGSLSLAVATVGSLPEVGLPVWAPAAVGAIGATAAYTKAATAKLPALSRLYRPGRWAGFAGWTSLALAAGGPWSPDLLGVLGVGVVASALLRPASQAWEISAQDRKSAEAQAKERLDLAVTWERRIDRVCTIKGTVVTDIRAWENPHPTDPDQTWRTGYTVKGKLPPSAGLDVLNRATAKLADDADLPAGCGVEVAGLPESRRTFELFVTTVDALAETIHYPSTYTRRSIYEGIPNGVYRDGTMVELDMKWKSTVLIGATGSGKSAQLAAVMASLLRCDDVIIWGIDPNGGGVFEPYLRPWVEGRASRPAIDWVAVDEAEMHKMLDFALAAIETRKIGYTDLMRAANDTKVPSSSAVPHIQIVTDETASLSPELKEKLRQLADRSRAASIRPLVCSLRALSDSIPRPLMAQMQNRIGLRVNEEEDLNYLFGWKSKLPSASEMPAEGYGLIRHDASENPRLFRGLFAAPDSAAVVAEATASWRPELDDVTVRVAPGVYMDRWERARKAGWLPGLGNGPKTTGPKKSTDPAPAAESPCPSASKETSKGKAPGPLGEMLSGLGESIRKKREDIERKNNGGPNETEVDKTFHALTHGLSLGGQVELPRVLVVALELSEGVKGAAVVDIATELRWSRPTVRARMKALEVEEQPKPDRWSTGAKPERGYAREALEATRDRILSGELEVPAGIDADE